MPVTYTFSANTKIKSSEVNTNFTDVDYASINNNKKIQWKNNVGTLDASIVEDASNDLNITVTAGRTINFIFGSTIISRLDDGPDLFEVRSGWKIRVSDSTNADTIDIYDNGTDAFVDANANRLRLQSPADVLLDPVGSSAHVNTFFPNANNIYNAGSVATHWTDVFGQNAYTTVSDEREKQDIIDCNLGLDFIQQLQPKSYKWKDSEEEEMIPTDFDDQGKKTIKKKFIQTHHRKHYGFVGQDIEEMLKQQNISTEDFGGFIKDTESGIYALRYGEFIAPIIKALQELAHEVEVLKKK